MKSNLFNNASNWAVMPATSSGRASKALIHKCWAIILAERDETFLAWKQTMLNVIVYALDRGPEGSVKKFIIVIS